MCGLTGLYSPEKKENVKAVVAGMTELIRRRGPDAEGLWSNNNQTLTLGHRRLAIVDLSSAGAQPMHSSTGRYVIVYNGEIYNYAELKKMLPDPENLRGHSDTEVFLRLVELKGIETALSVSRGMFAMAVYDTHESLIYLARDRVGEKPLYYYHEGQVLGFASQMDCLFPVIKGGPRVNPEVLDYFLKFGFSKRTLSLVKGIHKVEPGTCLRFDLKSGKKTEVRFWSYSEIPEEVPLSKDADWGGQLEKVLSQSVNEQVVASDVPLGAFLSGGIDSSLVVALAQKSRQNKIKTFSIGFHEKAWDEAPWAKKVAAHLGTEHYEEYFSEKDLLSRVADIPVAYDEPLGDASQLPTMLLSSFARGYVTVALSGDGGDELFGGYSRYQQFEKLKKIWALGIPLPFVKLAGRLVLDATRTETLVTALSQKKLIHLYETFLSPNKGDAVFRNSSAHLMTPYPMEELVEPDDLMAADIYTYLVDDIMLKVDKAAMFYSLETRAPFLSADVIAFSRTVPQRLKLSPTNKKIILKQVLAKHVPSELFERPKQGFGVPLKHWLRGSLKNWAYELIDAEASNTILDKNKMMRWWELHQSGKHDYSGRLWNLLMFLQWKRHHKISL